MSEAPIIGLPANTPPRPDTPAAFLDVHDVPPPRAETKLDAEEQLRLQKELTAARDRLQGGAAPPAATSKTAKSTTAKSVKSASAKPKAPQRAAGKSENASQNN